MDQDLYTWSGSRLSKAKKLNKSSILHQSDDRFKIDGVMGMVLVFCSVGLETTQRLHPASTAQQPLLIVISFFGALVLMKLRWHSYDPLKYPISHRKNIYSIIICQVPKAPSTRETALHVRVVSHRGHDGKALHGGETSKYLHNCKK